MYNAEKIFKVILNFQVENTSEIAFRVTQIFPNDNA